MRRSRIQNRFVFGDGGQSHGEQPDQSGASSNKLYALFSDSLYGKAPRLDQEGRLRTDYKELRPEVQSRVEQLWDQVTSNNIYELTDFGGYKTEFLRLFGFEMEGVDYEADVNTVMEIPGLV